jgi:predicted DNA-binding protein with PD1-like motif
VSKHIVQPGPVTPLRIESIAVPMRRMEIVLEPGLTLVEAVALPLEAAGVTAAGVVFSGIRLEPAKYVFPAFSPTPDHVAFYSQTFAPKGPLIIECANATFGRKEGQPFIHCHATWHDDAGTPGGGHLLPLDSIVSLPGRAVAAGCGGVAMVAELDAETNFPLFRPVEMALPGAAEPTGVVARLRPNEDLIEGIEAICRRYNIRDAIVHSCVASLIGAEFDDGRRVDDFPTEILALDGRVVDQHAELEIALIDVRGNVHKGRPTRGRNPILICCELFIVSSAPTVA